MILHRQGNPEGRTIFFIHGWPDDHRIWDRQVAAFEDRYHCVRVTLPGFDDGSTRGCDLPELAERLCGAIDALCVERDEERVVVVGHDWGAYLTYLVDQQRPSRIDRLVTIDVGGHARANGVREAAMTIAYQLPLAASWLARGALPVASDRVSRAMARWLGAPVDNRDEPLTARASYPYFYLWRALLHPAYRGALLHRYAPSRPLLYLYGTRKPLMFHTDRWLAMLAERDDCQVVPIDGGHWLPLSHPSEVNAAIERFLAAS